MKRTVSVMFQGTEIDVTISENVAGDWHEIDMRSDGNILPLLTGLAADGSKGYAELMALVETARRESVQLRRNIAAGRWE
jgi:hypothetical protein